MNIRTLSLLSALILLCVAFMSARQNTPTGFPGLDKFYGNRVQPAPGPVNNLRLIYKVPLNGDPEPFPVLVDGRLYLTTDKGMLYCLYIPTGAVHWSAQYNKVFGSPFISGNFLYLAAQDKTVYKINRLNGAVVWKTRFDSQITGCSAFYSGHVFCTADNSKLYRLNDIDGQPTSTHQTELISSVTGVSENTVVYLPGKNNVLISYDLHDLRTRFSVETEADIISPPLVGTEYVYFLDRRKLYAVNKITGKVQWIKRVNLRWYNDTIPLPRYYNGRIFLGLRGFQYQTGEGTWIVYGKGRQLTDSAIAGKYLYYGGKNFSSEGNKKGFIALVDIDERKVVNHFIIEEIPQKGLLVWGKNILFIDTKGLLIGYAGY